MKMKTGIRDLLVLFVFTSVLLLVPARSSDGPLRGHPWFHLDPFVLLTFASRGCLPPLLLVIGGVLTLMLTRRSPGTFCRNLCPLGAAQRCANRVSSATPSSPRNLKSMRLALFVILVLGTVFGTLSPMVFDPISITARGLQGFSVFLLSGGTTGTLWSFIPLVLIVLAASSVPSIWCRGGCPLGVVFSIQQDIGNKGRASSRSCDEEDEGLNPGRRWILIGGGALLFSGLHTRFGAAAGTPDRESPSACLRPPGVKNENSFLKACIRCGQCSTACPTGTITPSGLEDGVFGLLAPKVDFERSYCEPGCRECQKVCPTSALQMQTPEQRRTSRIGLAILGEQGCLRETGRSCRQCEAVFPFNAIYIGPVGGSGMPLIDRELCIGCGLCEFYCPGRDSNGRRAITVQPISDGGSWWDY